MARPGPFTLAAAGALVLVLAGGATAHAAAARASDAALATTQLPRGIRPLHYDVALVPHAATLTFEGHATVTIEVAAPTRSVTLNAVGLAFSSVRLLPASGRSTGVAAAAIDVDVAAQTATFSFARPVSAGRHRLAMTYAGAIGTQANGLFAIDYDTPRGRERALFTQFENASARRVVPSWDEPAYKATFALEATVPAAQMAISNMPVASTRPGAGGLVQVRFAASPRMSTYLLFFAVGDFERATVREGPTEVGIVARRGAIAQGRFALEASRRILREYNEYFALPYPLPKLDNVASPGSSPFFAAMENWGAIYSFERILLIDPTISNQADRQRVFSVAAHEIAHQWFGNLVTMHWWDDLWLNEGFATWMASRAVAKLHPEWRTWAASARRRDEAMAQDAFAATHPVVQHVETVDQVSQAFDSITYSKGAAVIAMLEHYVGDPAWRAGVRAYLKAHAYGNTVSDDLWREIERAAAKPVVDIAHDFTRQPGIPLLRVERGGCAGGTTTLHLTQGEFAADRPGKEPLRWRVPVIARAAGHAPARTIVAGGSADLVVPGCGLVVVNAGQTGYFRTAYSADQQAALRNGFARLDAIDQIGLVDDAWALGLAGTAPIADALELIERAPVDAAPELWAGIAERLTKLDAFYRGGDPARQSRWRAYAIARLAPVLARMGWDARGGEVAPLTVLRAELITALGELGDAATIAEARRRYALRESDPSAYPVALRKSILQVVARHADLAAWEALRAEARVASTPLVKDQLYRRLASARDEALARRALELALSDEPGATISAAMVGEVAEEHPDLAFEFAAARRERMDALLAPATRHRYYPRLGSGSHDAAMIDKIRRFAEANVPASSRRGAESAMAKVAYAATIANERLGAIDAWLASRRP